MLIVTIKTDQPIAEIVLYAGTTRQHSIEWSAHKQLAETIHTKLQELVAGYGLGTISGIVVFQGPGSFTGLRIGVSVANALAYSLAIPIVGSLGDNWQERGVERLLLGGSDTVVVPEYGSPPHITIAKK
jgi:tRNA threonylcarbamoyladenosine biosynthesis protein TsaB